MAVGVWTLALKSDYISLLASGTYQATAYILVVAGVVVMVTGVLGCCATFKERRNLLRLVSGPHAPPLGPAPPRGPHAPPVGPAIPLGPVPPVGPTRDLTPYSCL